MTQIISLSDRAAERLKEIMSKDQKSLGVRVGVKSGGCAGMAYIMEYAKEKKINHKKYGKYIIATNKQELSNVEAILTQGKKNNVEISLVENEKVFGHWKTEMLLDNFIINS